MRMVMMLSSKDTKRAPGNDLHAPRDWESRIDGDLFCSLDTDGDGTITKAELIAWLGNNGVMLPQSTLDFVMKEIDSSGDGSVDKEELVAYLKGMRARTAVQLRAATIKVMIKSWATYCIVIFLVAHILNNIQIHLDLANTIDVSARLRLNRTKVFFWFVGSIGFLAVSLTPIQNAIATQQRGVVALKTMVAAEGNNNLSDGLKHMFEAQKKHGMSWVHHRPSLSTNPVRHPSHSIGLMYHVPETPLVQEAVVAETPHPPPEEKKVMSEASEMETPQAASRTRSQCSVDGDTLSAPNFDTPEPKASSSTPQLAGDTPATAAAVSSIASECGGKPTGAVAAAGVADAVGAATELMSLSTCPIRRPSVGPSAYGDGDGIHVGELADLLESKGIPLPGKVLRSIFKDIDVDGSGVITHAELIAYLGNDRKVNPNSDDTKKAVFKRAIRAVAVWCMLFQLIATFLLFGNLCLWGLPPNHNKESKWVAWAFLLFFGFGLYRICFAQHAEQVESLEETRMELSRLAFKESKRHASLFGDAKNHKESGARHLFNAFDHDKSGDIGAHELAEGLMEEGFLTTEEILGEIFNEVLAQSGGNSDPKTITLAQWTNYVSQLTPKTQTENVRIALCSMLKDYKFYQICFFISAIIIYVTFFIRRWPTDIIVDGVYNELSRWAVINLLIGCTGALSLHWRGCSQVVSSREQSRLAMRNLLWATAGRLHAAHMATHSV